MTMLHNSGQRIWVSLLLFAGIAALLMFVAGDGRADEKEKAVENPPASQADSANSQNSQPKTDDEQPAKEQPEAQPDKPLDLNSQPNADQQSQQPNQPKTDSNSNRSESSRKWQSRDDSRTNPRYNSPGLNSSWDANRNLSSGNRPGASLGINIIESRSGEGLTVTRVASGTPADQMGIRSGDRITLINGQPTGPVDAFISTIRSMNPGDQVELSIVRDGNEQAFRGQLEPFGQAAGRSSQLSSNDEYQIYRSVIGGRDPNQFNPDVSQGADLNATRQASFEDRPAPSTPPQGDLDARLRRIEEQIDRLTQSVDQLRNVVGTPTVSSGLREAASDELRANGPQTQRARNNTATPQQNAAALKRDDRWDTENRFKQADLPGARERAAQEAARRQANQLGQRLQEQQRQQDANAQKGTAPANNSEVPPQPTTEPAPSEQPK
jgi:hypothetical protein